MLMPPNLAMPVGREGFLTGLFADANSRCRHQGTSRKQAQFDFGWRPEVSFDRITVAVLSASPLAQLFLALLVYGSRAALELRRRRLQIKRSGSESFHSSILLPLRNRIVVCQGGGPVIPS